MPWYRDRLCWILLAGAVAAFAAGLFPHSDEATDPVTGDRVEEFRLGFRDSPAYQSTRLDPARGGYHITNRIGWVSWSALAILAGVAALKGFQARRSTVSRSASNA